MLEDGRLSVDTDRLLLVLQNVMNLTTFVDMQPSCLSLYAAKSLVIVSMPSTAALAAIAKTPARKLEGFSGFPHSDHQPKNGKEKKTPSRG